MEVGEDMLGVLILVLCLVDCRDKDDHERSSGCQNLPCLLLRWLFGDGIIDYLDRTADDLLDLCSDIGVSVNNVCGS